MSLDHRRQYNVQVLLLYHELLEIVYRSILALSSDLLDVEPQVLEKLMDVHILLEDEDRPAVGSGVLRHQPL